MNWKEFVKDNKRTTDIEVAANQGTYMKQTELTKALWKRDVESAWLHYVLLRTRMKVLN